MARVFAYLMSNDLDEITDEGIFKDTSDTIKKALADTHTKNDSKNNIAKTAFEIALNKLI
jgi:Arc/MetJ-type ribon-helix-helix transcriptional regulator